MSTLTRILGWFYTQSLKLYPKEFRTDFGDEMSAVFVQAIQDRYRTGKALEGYAE